MIYVRIQPSLTRLGNWMFQYAAAKYAAPDGQVAFVLDDDWGVEAVRKYASLWPEAQYVRAAPVEADVRAGLFQDAKWVGRDVARQLYLGPLREAVKFPPEKLPPPSWVSIHVRRGDYLELPHRHPFVGEKYLREAVTRFSGGGFLVFSDDMPWCKRFFKGPQFHFAEGNGVLTDLFLMTQCRGGHICSNSTFSWWGAFLGEGRTVFPSMWYGPAIRDIDWRGLYFEGCEVITNRYSFGLGLKAQAYLFKNGCGNMLRRMGLRK